MPAVSIIDSLYFGDSIVIVDERGQLTLLKEHHDNLLLTKLVLLNRNPQLRRGSHCSV
jgi:hypothetical protein